MIRVVVFLILVALIASGAAWLADRPGDVVIVWLGRRIETSVAVAVAAIAILVALAMMSWSFIRLALRSPRLVGRAIVNRRRAQAHRAISHGLIAVGAGDMRAARRHASEADRLSPREPLTLLLNAQVAQMAGDRTAAERAFSAMAQRGDTKLLGIRGLYVEAQRRDDAEAAHRYAEAAAAAAPSLPWAGQAVLEDRTASGDWAGALTALENMRGQLDKTTYRRRRAVLLTARALAEADGDANNAKTLALEAVKLAPDLVPAAALAGRLMAENGELRRAARVIETAWRYCPHPDLAEVYTHLRYGDSARDRLARVQILARQSGRGEVEGALALARAAIDAQEFSTARAALKPLFAAPTQRVAMMMAELEEAEHGDIGRAREWVTRALHAQRDPVWIADGIVSDQWLPVSPVTGALDAFRWKPPVTEIARAERAPEVFEAEPSFDEEPPPVSPAPPVTMAAATANSASIAPAEPAATVTVGAAPSPSAPTAPSPSAAAPATATAVASEPAPGAPPKEPRVDAVIPLVHAPDDPGPDTVEPSLAEPPRRRSLFRS